MNLEEFKRQMNTETQERCNQQEKTIKELHQKIKELRETVRIMQNRCFAQTSGLICMFCTYFKDGSCTSYADDGRNTEE